MTQKHGFELIQEAYIAEVDSQVQHYRHIKTGAELISCANNDENKSFTVAFKTPPPDSTGLPHILEHSVLCGSEKYPVKDPFVSLIRTSLSTFINAMTFPDMTIYPVASPNMKDFYNLVDVYLDATFHPLITEDTFRQEGWHYITDESGFKLQGVVFNEMKGYYSTPEVILDEATRANLFPDTPYAYSYGGDPLVIPQLTYEQFKNFHETYYHPSNARFFFYGDDPVEERLSYLNRFLEDFDKKRVDSELPMQSKFEAPRQITEYYDAGEDEQADKGYVAIAWLLDEVTNVEVNLALEILEHILLGTPASPLKNALLESGLGEDLTGDGFSRYSRQTSLSTGLKGAKLTESDAIQKLILDTLQKLADEGIEDATVQASLNTVDFALRERNTGRFPRGLATMITILPTWMHGGDPVQALAFEAPLQNVRAQYEANPQYFAQLIQTHLLDNPHRVTIILKPKQGVNEERAVQEADWIVQTTQHFDQETKQFIEDTAKHLKILQETPDDPDDIAKIPTLGIEDIDPFIKTTPIATENVSGAEIIYHDIATSGIAYLDFGFDLHTLPQHLIPYLSLYGQALTEIGTRQQNYVQLAQRIGVHTGGIGASLTTSRRVNMPDSIGYLFVRTKAKIAQIPELMAIVQDILLDLNLDNKERFKQMVLEAKASKEAYLGLSGHVNANLRLRAHFDEAGWIDEQTSGVSQLLFLRDLANRIDTEWEAILTDLQQLHQTLINRQTLVISATLQEDVWRDVREQIAQFIDRIPSTEPSRQVWECPALPPAEGLGVATQVNFVGKGANLYDLNYSLHGSYAVIFKHLNLDYMWTKIRVQGGAYGGGCFFNPISGVATFLSWQDPNLLETLNVYDGVANYLRQVNLNKDDLEKAIIGAIGDLDSYLLPDAKGFQSTMRHLIGSTDAMRQQIRDEVLATQLSDFRALAMIFDQVAASGKIVITSASSKLNQANEQMANRMEITKLQ